MDDIHYAKILNRIIQGRLRLRFGDLVLFVYQPSQDILEESFDIYDTVYEEAYLSGSFVEEERLELLINNDMWSPVDDKQAEKISKDVEDLKVQAYKTFFKKKQLLGIKKSIIHMERKEGFLRSRKSVFEQVTCKGLASYAKSSWIIQQTTRDVDGNLYDFSHVSLSKIMQRAMEESIPPSVYRGIARSSSWRAMWNGSKTRDSVFGKAACDLTADQISLISYSMMYDNVYENPDSPKEEIIADDVCLDGWFIEQRRKHEKDKAKAQADAMLTNPKIANSQEVFMMASDQREANEIFDLNSAGARHVVQSRQEQIKENTKDGANLHFKDLADVKQTRMINAVNQASSTIKGRR